MGAMFSTPKKPDKEPDAARTDTAAVQEAAARAKARMAKARGFESTVIASRGGLGNVG